MQMKISVITFQAATPQHTRATMVEKANLVTFGDTGVSMCPQPVVHARTKVSTYTVTLTLTLILTLNADPNPDPDPNPGHSGPWTQWAMGASG